MGNRIDNLNVLFPPFARVIEEMVSKPFDCTDFAVFETWRHPDRQDELFRKGRSKAQRWQSWHQYGLAVDIVAKPGGVWSWDDKQPWDILGEYGIAEGLTWGGRWKMRDMAHFQFPVSLSRAECREIAEGSGGILELWDQI